LKWTSLVYVISACVILIAGITRDPALLATVTVIVGLVFAAYNHLLRILAEEAGERNVEKSLAQVVQSLENLVTTREDLEELLAGVQEFSDSKEKDE